MGEDGQSHGQLTVILPLKKGGCTTLPLRFLDLEQVRVDEISHRPLVESRTMLIDRLLKETCHFRPIFRQFVSNLLQAGQVTHYGDEVDGSHAAEQFESLFDQVHKSFESGVSVLESYSHYDGADNVADRHSKGGRDVGRRATFRRQSAKKRFNLALK